MLADYPVMLQLSGRRCVVVGGGAVGRRKAAGLLDAGARVVLIDPRLDGETLPVDIETVSRAFRETDLDGAFLVFAATGSSVTNRAVADAARSRAIPVNVADDPGASDFTIPASFRRGDWTLAVASGGASPAAAAVARDELRKSFPEEWQTFLDIAAKLRSRRLTSSSLYTYNQQVLRKLIGSGILAMIAAADAHGIDRLLESECGAGCSLADLGVGLSKGVT